MDFARRAMRLPWRRREEKALSHPSTDNPKSPLPIFTVEITCSQQWGDDQQNHLDAVLVWCARLRSFEALAMIEHIKTILNHLLPGAMAPISEGAAKAMDALGKEKPLCLLEPGPEK
jgi:hypothetical protein